MATFSTTIPDAAVPDTVRGLGPRMVDSADPTIAAIAAKVVNGTATTATEKKALAEAFTQRNLYAVFIDQRAQDAATTARNDPANKW